MAFSNLVLFVEHEAIEMRNPIDVSRLMELYKEEYIAAGGLSEEMDTYQQHTLLSKADAKLGKKLLFQNCQKKLVTSCTPKI